TPDQRRGKNPLDRNPAVRQEEINHEEDRDGERDRDHFHNTTGDRRHYPSVRDPSEGEGEHPLRGGGEENRKKRHQARRHGQEEGHSLVLQEVAVPPNTP